jgi:hypothetical protein
MSPRRVGAGPQSSPATASAVRVAALYPLHLLLRLLLLLHSTRCSLFVSFSLFSAAHASLSMLITPPSVASRRLPFLSVCPSLPFISRVCTRFFFVSCRVCAVSYLSCFPLLIRTTIYLTLSYMYVLGVICHPSALMPMATRLLLRRY